MGVKSKLRTKKSQLIHNTINPLINGYNDEIIDNSQGSRVVYRQTTKCNTSLGSEASLIDDSPGNQDVSDDNNEDKMIPDPPDYNSMRIDEFEDLNLSRSKHERYIQDSSNERYSSNDHFEHLNRNLPRERLNENVSREERRKRRRRRESSSRRQLHATQSDVLDQHRRHSKSNKKYTSNNNLTKRNPRRYSKTSSRMKARSSPNKKAIYKRDNMDGDSICETPLQSLFNVDQQYFSIKYEFYCYLAVVISVQVYGVYVTLLDTIEIKKGQC